METGSDERGDDTHRHHSRKRADNHCRAASPAGNMRDGKPGIAGDRLVGRRLQRRCSCLLLPYDHAHRYLANETINPPTVRHRIRLRRRRRIAISETDTHRSRDCTAVASSARQRNRQASVNKLLKSRRGTDQEIGQTWAQCEFMPTQAS